MKNTSKIIVWGDSLAKGIVYDSERDKYTVLQENAVALTAQASGLQIINRARMGLTVTKGNAIMERDLHDGMSADAALIEFGGNDSDFDWRTVSEHPEQTHTPRTTTQQFESIMRSMIDKLKCAGIEPVLATLPPVCAERYLDFISRGLNRQSILAWLGDVNHIYRYQEQYSALIARIARQTGCRLLDLRSAFLRQWSLDSLFCMDGIHPNACGQALMQRAALDFMGV